MQEIKQPTDLIAVMPDHPDPCTVSQGIALTQTINPHSSQALTDPTRRQAIVAAAWQDMRKRRKNGEPINAQEYFVQQSGNVDEDLAVDLIYAEYVSRLECGESPRLSEYLTRFPQFAAAIKRQLEVHDAMDSSEEALTWSISRGSDVKLAADQPAGKPPTHLGKYVLLSELSSGGQATVYRAVHPTLGRELVLKLSHKSLVENSAAASRLLDEGRILADLDHPNLARVYDMGLDDGYPYLAMEYVRGRTLDQYAKDEKLDWRDRARIAAKVAAAVSAAHRKNIVHLDIKPKNIIIDEDGNPRLLDFGLARLFDAFHIRSEQADISGTLQFMAPEQARGDGATIGRRTDIFGLGGVLYFLLTNKVPFPGGKSSEVLPRIAKGEWEAQPLKAASIPQQLKAICTRAMAPKVEDRYASADDFASSLYRYIRYARLRTLLAKAAILLIVLVTAAFLIRQYVPATRDASPTLAAKVRQPDGHFTDLANALPLTKGDQLQFHTDIPAGMHASLFAFTSAGDLQKLASWEPADEARQLQYPESSSATVPLDEHSGTEFIFLCTRSEAPITLEEVRSAWPGNKPLEQLPDYTVALIEAAQIRFENFGRGLGPVILHDNPESVFQQRLEPVLKALETRFSDVAGIAFTHKR